MAKRPDRLQNWVAGTYRTLLPASVSPVRQVKTSLALYVYVGVEASVAGVVVTRFWPTRIDLALLLIVAFGAAAAASQSSSVNVNVKPAQNSALSVAIGVVAGGAGALAWAVGQGGGALLINVRQPVSLIHNIAKESLSVATCGALYATAAGSAPLWQLVVLGLVCTVMNGLIQGVLFAGFIRIAEQEPYVKTLLRDILMSPSDQVLGVAVVGILLILHTLGGAGCSMLLLPSIFQRHSMARLTRAEEERDELFGQASHDMLTGLVNRRLLVDRLDQELRRRTLPRDPSTLLFLDLDSFKPINDRHGHKAGDIVLKVVAKRLVGACRDGDTVARLGGDEFAVILLGTAEQDAVLTVGNRIIQSVCEPIVCGVEKVTVGTSIGFAPLRTGMTAQEVLDKADAAMYEAKKAGKGGIYGEWGEGRHWARAGLAITNRPQLLDRRG